jgi:hypothetical protein
MTLENQFMKILVWRCYDVKQHESNHCCPMMYITKIYAFHTSHKPLYIFVVNEVLVEVGFEPKKK